MSTTNRTSGGLSELTLTPAIDGVSDYQQYLEKTSKKGSSLHTRSRGEISVVNSPPPIADTEIHRANSKIVPPSPTVNSSAAARFERLKPARSRKERRRRLNRVEAAEDPYEYPGPLALFFLTVGICLSVFLVSLDRTIVATVSIPLKLEHQSSSTHRHPQRLYRVSPMTSTRQAMLAGMEAHTFSQLELCSQYMAGYSSSSTSSGPSSAH